MTQLLLESNGRFRAAALRLGITEPNAGLRGAAVDVYEMLDLLWDFVAARDDPDGGTNPDDVLARVRDEQYRLYRRVRDSLDDRDALDRIWAMDTRDQRQLDE